MVPQMQAQHVEPGMMLDLEGDPYIECDDPDCTWSTTYEYEYGVVDSVELEEVGLRPAVVYLDNGDTYAFPRTHKLKVVSR